MRSGRIEEGIDSEIKKRLIDHDYRLGLTLQRLKENFFIIRLGVSGICSACYSIVLASYSNKSDWYSLQLVFNRSTNPMINLEKGPLNKEEHIAALKLKFESYASISAASWSQIESLITFKTLEKNEILLRSGQVARKIYFVCKGALRAFIADDDGNTYSKNIFLENDLAGSTVSYLLTSPSKFTLESLEETILISLDYKKYRLLIEQNMDLKDFYIAYLESNWVIDKEQREVSLVMENATDRYLKLLQKHPDIDQRIQKIHIASHLGITPTQLSRIRKSLKKND